MTGRISIPALRDQEAWGLVLTEEAGQGYTDCVCIPPDVRDALVEAVEAARATFDQIAAEAWADGDVPRMRRWAEDASDGLRARFDFGEEA